MFQTWCFFVTLLVGSIAFPVNEEEDNSFFFDHPVDPFIINGTVAGSVPHMVALTSGISVKSFFCGASIISDRFVLSAAHCLITIPSPEAIPRSLRGNVGSNRWDTGNIQIIFRRVLNHPNYNNDIIKDDISLLQTASPIIFSDNVKPVALSFDFIGGGVPTIANGWGRIGVHGPLTKILMELRQFTVDGEKCISQVTRVAKELNRVIPPVHPEIEICSFLRKTTGMCRGDSGSALILQERYEQIGIVSWGVPCAHGAPDMFVRISAYRSWIEQNMANL